MTITPFGWFWLSCGIIFMIVYKYYTKKSIFDFWLIFGSVFFGPIMLLATGIMFTLCYYYKKKRLPKWLQTREKIAGVNALANISWHISLFVSTIVLIVVCHFFLKVI